MARRDPLLPNAAIVARREYRDRVRSRLYVASTIILMTLALGVSLTPIALRYLDRQSVTVLSVVSTDRALAERAVEVVDSLLNNRPDGVDPSTWRAPFRIEAGSDRAAAEADLASGEIGGMLLIERRPTGQLHVIFRTPGVADAVRAQLIGFASLGMAVLDWTANLPEDAQLGAFQPPQFDLESTTAPTEGGQPVSQQEIASRSFLGTVFIVLMFISILIYGMWVATGVAAEKSSRVMELMISAASPRQLIIGKVVGIGGAGLTQYVAIAIPALVVLAFQERIAAAVLGPGADAGAPITGLTAGLLLGYGTLFLLGFTLYAFVYAAVGSFVSRPDDLQTLSLPLSLLAMAGYLASLPILLSGGAGGGLSRLASFVPPFSPFAMLARLMVGRVEPWEVALSLGLLVLAIAVVMVAAIRIYTAGVLLYGQRPGMRAFLKAARRAG
jgi:ABC-2 type transport system permease protein